VKWERGDVGKERGEGEDMEWLENVRKNKLPKLNATYYIFGICRRPFLGATAPCHTFLERSFHEQHFLTDSMPLTYII